MVIYFQRKEQKAGIKPSRTDGRKKTKTVERAPESLCENHIEGEGCI